MLNKAERLQILKSIRICSIVGLLPTEVNLATRRLNVPSRKKKIISDLFCGLFILHTLYKSFSLAYVYLFVPNVPLHQLVIHAILVMGSVMLVYWYYASYVGDQALFFAYVADTLLGNTGGPTVPKDEFKKDWTKRILEYSMQDLIAIGMLYMAVLAILVISASLVYDPSMSLLLYAALLTRLQNWATFGLCLLEEIRFLVVLVAIMAPVLQLQVISFDLVSAQLRLMKSTLENGTQSVGITYRYLRRLQLYLAMVNDVNRYMIFTWKLVSISMSVLSGYAAIAHFHEYPVFGVMYYVILFDATLVYTVIYEKAFKIPELFGQVSACALLRAHTGRRAGFRRQILSVPRTGIQVGNFHKMERASTLIYMDFVLKNIVNMLVAYGGLGGVQM